jgi:hypothetical protein
MFSRSHLRARVAPARARRCERLNEMIGVNFIGDPRHGGQWMIEMY